MSSDKDSRKEAHPLIISKCVYNGSLIVLEKLVLEELALEEFVLGVIVLEELVDPVFLVCVVGSSSNLDTIYDGKWYSRPMGPKPEVLALEGFVLEELVDPVFLVCVVGSSSNMDTIYDGR